jgi:arginase
VRKTGKTLRILWLDAHADFNTHEVTPSGNVHGMPVACLCGVGPEALTGLGGSVPSIRADQIRQIGIRSVDAGEKKLVHEHGLDIYDMRYIDEIGMKKAMEEALEGIDANTHVHVSFDVDFLDPAIAPGVGTTVPGGPNYPRGAAGDGDDRRHRPRRLDRHRRAQSRLRRPQPHRQARRRPDREPVRQVDAHAAGCPPERPATRN